jgi:hypothetical protein
MARGWTLAEFAGDSVPDAMQRLVERPPHEIIKPGAKYRR